MNRETEANKLIIEKSPYLLQHAYNPVNWYPWGEEAFQKAKEEDKPIFLSIGYSTCHWCHVMERESFEDLEVASVLNEYFISIKVDREERPDIDNIYMTVCQMMTGRGGWPLTIIMTPEKKPFFAGTYIPKKQRFGMKGLISLLKQIIDLWENERERILETSNQITSRLKSKRTKKKNEYDISELLEEGYHQLENRFDDQLGGFAISPKFPSPHNLLFLLRYWRRTNDSHALYMVEKTLTQMYLGGIFDHIGYGFHRYSTDREWLLPHFEKMLYDQAMLIYAYTEGFQATKNKQYKEVVEKIVEYLERDMMHEEGGFYSAEDADSEGVEGKFYIWEKQKIIDILGEEEGALFCEFYNVEEKGNYLDESTKKRTGKNIPYLALTLSEFAKKRNIDLQEFEEKISACRKKLFNQREKRIHPLKDDKILTDWNGLLIASLAKAARVFDNDNYLSMAEKAVSFIQKNLQQANNRLLHRYRAKESAIQGNLDDYIFLIWGYLELYETSFNADYLQEALILLDLTFKYFWDKENGGFYFTPEDGESLLTRDKIIYDGAAPSANSVSLLILIKIAKMLSRTDLEEKAEEIIQAFVGEIERQPSAYSMFLAGLEYIKGPSYEIILVGEKDSHEFINLIEQITEEYIPNKILLLKDTSLENYSSRIKKLEELLEDYNQIDSHVTVYVCENYVCNKPVTDSQKLKQILNAYTQTNTSEEK